MSDEDLDLGLPRDVPPKDQLPMLPFDVAVWGDNEPRYGPDGTEPAITDAALRRIVRENEKR